MSDTQHQTVAALTPEPPSLRSQVIAIPLVTISFLIVLSVLGAMIWPFERYESAPGRAQPVTGRLQISAKNVDVFEPDNGIRFVTAMGTRVNPLQSFMGWVDPYVDVLTCKERFGDCKPELNRQVQLGAMATAKEIAEYVALSRLGFAASLVEGPVQVAGFDASVCPEDAPAQRACRVLSVGDVVHSIDLGKGPIQIDRLSQLVEALKQARPGNRVRLAVAPIDSDEQRIVDVELLADPSDPNRTLIGFNLRDTRTVKLPFDIEIDTDRIGGPSAGLSFTLALIDYLSPGELTPKGGVAVTGTISDDGSVGAIGLLLQKAIAVRHSGARYFLVPSAQSDAEIDEARRVVGKEVEIIPVASLDEALRTLVRLGGAPIGG